MKNNKMQVKEVRTHHIPSQDGVDSINLFVVWYGECRSQVTIQCWDHAWTAYWGAHWVERVEDFITDPEIIDYLISSFSRTRQARERKWLRQIIESIRKYFKNLEVQNG